VKVQPVDLFPHTQHVENVVLLVKRAVRKEPITVEPATPSTLDEGSDGLDLDESPLG